MASLMVMFDSKELYFKLLHHFKMSHSSYFVVGN